MRSWKQAALFLPHRDADLVAPIGSFLAPNPRAAGMPHGAGEPGHQRSRLDDHDHPYPRENHPLAGIET